MSVLVLPICGLSTRYPDQPPKWAIEYQGKTMLEHSISGLPLDFFDKIIVIMLQKHYTYPTLSIPHTKVALEYQTANQVQTVYEGLIQANITGEFVVKDCDNYFKIQPIHDNFVAYHILSGEIHNAENKSYIEINEHGNIINIVEKRVVSSTFCCGMYGFKDVEQFIDQYNKTVVAYNYLSDVIFQQLLRGRIFKPVMATDYIDWGTLDDWQRFKWRTL